MFYLCQQLYSRLCHPSLRYSWGQSSLSWSTAGGVCRLYFEQFACLHFFIQFLAFLLFPTSGHSCLHPVALEIFMTYFISLWLTSDLRIVYTVTWSWLTWQHIPVTWQTFEDGQEEGDGSGFGTCYPLLCMHDVCYYHYTTTTRLIIWTQYQYSSTVPSSSLSPFCFD